MWSLHSSQIPSAGSLQCNVPCPRINEVQDRTHSRTRRRDVATSALFSPPPFRPDKLTVRYQDATSSTSGPVRVDPRRYTLTHNDITGDLQLTVGSDYNYNQISGFYTRLLRDEIVAEWRFDPRPSLHVFCHVSGEERWLAPPALRDYIFRRELPLVLDTFLWADQHLLEQCPELARAEIYVHFQSCQAELDVVERWGVLGQRSTWRPMPQSIMQRIVLSVLSALQIQPPQQFLTPQQLQQQSCGVLNTPEAGLKLNNAVPVVASARLDVIPQPSKTFTPSSNACEHPSLPEELINGIGRGHNNVIHPHVEPTSAVPGNRSQLSQSNAGPEDTSVASQAVSLSGLSQRAVLVAATQAVRVRGRVK